jgi:multiple sugar transport system substrate-binding protein
MPKYALAARRRVEMGVTRRTVLSSSAAAAALAGAHGVGGCGPAPESRPAAGAVSGKVVYLSSSPGGDLRQQEEQKLFADFNAQHPKVQVEVVVGAGGWAPAKEKFIVSAAGGQPIDLTQNGWGVWTDLSEGGVITELTPLLKRDKISLAEFMEGAVQAYTVDGKTWALPVTVSADALFYNVDLFKANGIPEPPQNPEDKTWTMDKFLEVAQKLTRSTPRGWAPARTSGSSRGTTPSASA